MIFPFNIRIGNVQLEIIANGKEDKEILRGPPFEYTSRSWEEIRKIVDRKLQEWEVKLIINMYNSLKQGLKII